MYCFIWIWIWITTSQSLSAYTRRERAGNVLLVPGRQPSWSHSMSLCTQHFLQMVPINDSFWNEWVFRWVGLQTLWRFRLGDLTVGGMVGAWCFGCLSGPPGFTCWIIFAPVFGFVSCLVLTFASSPCCVLVCVFWGTVRWWVRGLSSRPNNYVSWSTGSSRVRLAPLGKFGPSSETFYWPFQGGTSFVDLLCFFCLVLTFLWLCERLFICALWSHAGKGLTSWLSFVVSGCEFVTFPLFFSWLYRFIDSWSLHPNLLSTIQICTAQS